MADEPPVDYSLGVLIRFEGVIDPRLEQYLYRKLEVAKNKGADLLIIEIDSPGGYLESSLSIADRLRKIEWARTVAFVPGEPIVGEAISGAAVVALGCDEIVMAPDTLIGDVGAIYEDERGLFRYAPEKIVSYLSEQMRLLAAAKGRPPALAEAMVNKDREVFRVRNVETDEETFMSDAEIEDDDANRWEKLDLVTESEEGRFLTVSGARAVELTLADGNASSREELQQRYALEKDLVVIEPSGVDTAVFILNMPWVTGLLFFIGLVALYIEFSAPGTGLGGVTAALCFAIFFWSRFLGGTADWLELVLFLSGLLFIGVEILVLPGFGIAGLTGILLLAASLLMACLTFGIPQTQWQLNELTYSLLAVFVAGGAFVITAVVINRHLGTMPLFRRFVLHPPGTATVAADAAQMPDPAAVPPEPALGPGDVGTADSLLRPAGKARFGARYVDVVAEGDFIDKGARIRIAEIRGNRILVEEAGETD